MLTRYVDPRKEIRERLNKIGNDEEPERLVLQERQVEVVGRPRLCGWEPGFRVDERREGEGAEHTGLEVGSEYFY